MRKSLPVMNVPSGSLHKELQPLGITAIAESKNPPSLVALGADAFNAFGAVAEAERAELDQWRDLSLSTGIEG